MSNEAGTRLACESCGSQALVTTTGEGTISCCGVPMQPAGAPGGQTGSARDG